MRSCKHGKLVAFIVTALWTSAAIAQGPARGQAFRAGGESPNDPTYLLGSESVQKELGLSDTQKASVQKLRDADNASFSVGFRGQSQAAIQDKLEQRAEQNRKRLSKILTAKQFDRLNEINIQVAGVSALSFDDVAEKLGLSAEQKSKLKNLGDESRRKMSELYFTNNGQQADAATQQRNKQKISEFKAERSDHALAVLTDDQREKFTRLQGAKFDTSKLHSNRRSFSSRGRTEAPETKPPGV